MSLSPTSPGFAAILLAAGQSRRMGRPKMTLPWGTRTVITQVASTFLEAGVADVVAVTGGWRAEVESALSSLAVRTVFNPRYAEDAMMLSLQAGLQALADSPAQAAFVALGDQPQIETAVVQALALAYGAAPGAVLIPSYHMRRGHPWLLGRSLWAEALAAPASTTLRLFLEAHSAEISYLPVESASILQDLDTPDDYARASAALNP